MTTSTTRGGRTPGRVLKSPLAVPGGFPPSPAGGSGALAPASGRAPLADREATIAEFQGHLRTVNNRDGRPFEEKTSLPTRTRPRAWTGWMTANKVSGDFTVVDVAMLKRYFRDYYLEHGQGGTHTLQRNLIQPFSTASAAQGTRSRLRPGT